MLKIHASHPNFQDGTAGCSGTPPICRQAQTKLEVALYMFLWSPDTEAVLVAMSCFRHLCEEADIRCGVDEVSVHNFLPNYNTFMEFASVSNMMSTGKCGQCFFHSFCPESYHIWLCRNVGNVFKMTALQVYRTDSNSFTWNPFLHR